MLYEACWVVAMTWAWTKLSANAFVATDTPVCTVRFVANVCVEKLYESWYEHVMMLEGVANPPGCEEAL